MSNVKELLVGIVLVFLLGVSGFLYRTAMEQPFPGGSGVAACTLEAKICPDGTTVGRTGPSCTFASCPLPNVAVSSAGIAFVLPAGYALIATSSLSGTSIAAAYDTTAPTSASTTATLFIRDYAIPTGESAAQVMLDTATLDPSGRSPTSMSQFATTTISAHTFQRIQIGRFEGQVQTAYYLPRAHDVLRFDVTERNVANWTDPTLVVDKLPGHIALRALLATLSVGP
ncbi:MAG: hypothetical protein B7X04_00150 [Parcubacteria group bacterium 21-54-25]|nr:MAG: hypothetical protein B7X04_00150 [Parcubacteria group bacterium 21-54-25]HQU07531.1 hypothetical protein [Candidatus Paceibacterota bacterium]